MSQKKLFMVFESGFTIDFSTLCEVKTIHQTNFSSNRKLISQLKKTEPDYIISEFIYSPSLGTQISNLDGLLGSVERYCKKTQLIIYTESRYREKLETVREKFKIHHVLEYPVQASDICPLIL
ncbi:MAG: hypothetical protein OQL19_10170 [Gammaproteobacteria bacterium]|nr:hypothetical protein [Gammaproteobacteria bacterium]